MIKELWKDIKDYEGLYKISNIGRVRSVERYSSIGRLIKGRIMKQHENNNGYMRIRLNKNNIRGSFYIHRLVAEAFILNPKNKLQVNHIDSNKQNNTLYNLEWSTQSENMKHMHNNK